MNDKEKEMIHNAENGFFYTEAVDKRGREAIGVRFETLINAQCEAPYDWYKDLGLDKSKASKIKRGLIIPPQWQRIKIANYFNTDSATIWTLADLSLIAKIEEMYVEKDKVAEDGSNEASVADIKEDKE